MQSPGEMEPGLARAASEVEYPPIATTRDRYQHDDYIDGQRGLGCLLVVAYHSRLIPLGHSATLFLILSSLTLVRSLHQRMMSERLWGLNFAIRRFLRIAPAFYASILLYMFVFKSLPRAAEFKNERIPDVEHILSLVSFTNQYGMWINGFVHIEWTIAVLALWYLVLPLFALTLVTFRAQLIAVFFSAAVSSWLSLHIGPTSPWCAVDWCLNLSFPVQMPALFFGLACATKLPPTWSDNSRHFTHLPSFVGLLFSALLCVGVPYQPYYIILSCLCWLPMLASCPVSRCPLLENPLAVYIGKVSYSVYLISPLVTSYLVAPLLDPHLAVQTKNIEPGTHIGYGLLHFGVATLLSLAAASVMHFTIERPCRAAGDALIGYLEAVAEAKNIGTLNASEDKQKLLSKA